MSADAAASAKTGDAATVTQDAGTAATGAGCVDVQVRSKAAVEAVVC